MKKLLVLLSLNFGFQTLNCQSPQELQVSGITTIHGTINNFNKYYPEYKTITIDVDDWTNAFRRTYSTEIDSSGKFSLSFLIFNSQVVYMNYKNISPPLAVSSLFVSPNDTLELIIDADSYPNDIKYFGKTAKSCENLDHYGPSENLIFKVSDYKLNSILRDSLSFNEYKTWRDSIYKSEQKRVENYLQQNSIDPLFTSWLRSLCKLRYYTDLINYNPSRKRFNMPNNYNDTLKPFKFDTTFIKTIFKVIKSVDLDTSENLTTNSSFYFMFINSMHYPIEQLAFHNYAIDRTNVLSQSQFRDPEKNFNILVNLTKEEYRKKIFPYIIKTANSLIKNNQIKESLIAHSYTMALEYQNIDVGLDTTLAHISNPYIKASLINEYNSHKWRTASQNSLNVNNEGDTLLNYLKNKYKGYVQYITIWRTWYGNRFKYTSEINKTFEGKKVAFIYLCYYSDKTKWEKDKNEYKLAGENIFLTNDQSSSLAKILNLTEVNPRYIIIDKSSRIVNERAPWPDPNPRLQNMLIQELTKYLNK